MTLDPKDWAVVQQLQNGIAVERRPFDYLARCAGICGGCRARAYYYSGGDYMAEEPWCLYLPAESEAPAVG